MQKIVPIRLHDDASLRETVESFRLVQQGVSDLAFAAGRPLKAVELHKLAYSTVEHRGLKSQLVCTAIREVAAAYAAARRRHRRLHCPIQFNKGRALFLIGKAKRDAAPPRKETIRVWTMDGRKDLEYSIPAQFKQQLREAQSYDALAVSLRKGRVVATLAITVKAQEARGSLPIGVSANRKNEITAVNAADQSLRIVAVAQSVMEEVHKKTRSRLRQRLIAKKTDGRETRSVRRVLKRLGKRHHLRTRTFCHTAAKRLIEWAGRDTALAIEDLRKPAPSRSKKHQTRRPHFYEVLVRRIEEKASQDGIPVHYVAAADSTKRCSMCGSAGESAHSQFRCSSCSSNMPSGKNAALYVRNKFTVARPWADVNQP